MRRQLFFALLTIGIFGFNLLPSHAVNNKNIVETAQKKDVFNRVNGVRGCVMIPEMGFFCW